LDDVASYIRQAKAIMQYPQAKSAKQYPPRNILHAISATQYPPGGMRQATCVMK